jgi:hypothetical protein
MDQPSNSIVIVKLSNVEDKSNGQSNNKLMVVEPGVDFCLDGTHNYIMTKRLEGHIYAERLIPEETVLVREMLKNNATPRNILLIF